MLSLDESFTQKQQRILEQNKNQREDASSTSEHSVPSCEPLDLSPSPSMHGATLGMLSTMNAQLSDLKSCCGFVSLGKYRNTHVYLKDQPKPHLKSYILQTIPETPSSQRPSSLPSNHSTMTKNDLQPPNYYKVMEFDPSAPAVTIEAMIKKIDVYHHKRAVSHSDC
ncbi:hypothetical protein GH733_005882 [Mirounga leonina]|nr:hypothetical protein GH733_005882 [Mirounga leonina]